MLAVKKKSWMACFPDENAIIDIEALGLENWNWNRQQFATVKIKTHVASSSLDKSLRTATMGIRPRAVGDECFLQHMLRNNCGQVMHQCAVLHVEYVM